MRLRNLEVLILRTSENGRTEFWMKSVCTLHVGLGVQTSTALDKNGSLPPRSPHYHFVLKDQRVRALNQKDRAIFMCTG